MNTHAAHLRSTRPPVVAPAAADIGAVAELLVARHVASGLTETRA